MILDLGEPGSGVGGVRPQGTVVLLLSGEVDRKWAADAAIELGATWARSGRRIVLADLHLDDPLLHAGLDVSNLEGVVDIFLYGASLSRIAQPVRGGEFYLIPAGTYAPDVGEIYRHPRWRKLVAGFRDTDAALVLFVPGHAADVEALASWASEAILLGPPGDRLLEEVARSGMEVLAVLEPPPPPAAAPPPPPPPRDAAAEEPAAATAVDPPAASEPRPRDAAPSTRPIEPDLELPPPPVRRRPERRSASTILWILFAVIVLGTVAYLVATLRPDLVPGVAPTGGTEPATAEADAAPSASRMGELLPYSVQVRAFTSFNAARAELEEDRSRLPSASFFISPEEIQGIVYYKILSGLATDTAGAQRLRDRLVEIGSIDEEDAVGTWSLLQFTPLAFDLGEFESPERASVRADSLLGVEIPSYVAAVPYSDGSRRFQLYGGAYRDSASAASMRQLLESAGLTTRLTARTGLPVTLDP